MNIAQEKVNLIQQIAMLNDTELIDALKNMVAFGIKKQKNTDVDFWETLSEKQRDRINESITQADSGQKAPHHEVMAQFRKQLQA
jgi:predicted transcriptional regulator